MALDIWHRFEAHGHSRSMTVTIRLQLVLLLMITMGPMSAIKVRQSSVPSAWSLWGHSLLQSSWKQLCGHRAVVMSAWQTWTSGAMIKSMLSCVQIFTSHTVPVPTWMLVAVAVCGVYCWIRHQADARDAEAQLAHTMSRLAALESDMKNSVHNREELGRMLSDTRSLLSSTEEVRVAASKELATTRTKLKAERAARAQVCAAWAQERARYAAQLADTGAAEQRMLSKLAAVSAQMRKFQKQNIVLELELAWLNTASSSQAAPRAQQYSACPDAYPCHSTMPAQQLISASKSKTPAPSKGSSGSATATRAALGNLTNVAPSGMENMAPNMDTNTKHKTQALRAQGKSYY